jgi:hypothetical protein
MIVDTVREIFYEDYFQLVVLFPMTLETKIVVGRILLRISGENLKSNVLVGQIVDNQLWISWQWAHFYG